MPLINIIGPPGSGKSTLCTSLVERFGGKHLTIDAYRELAKSSFLNLSNPIKIEKSAWKKLKKDIKSLNNSIIFLETTGTSWQVKDIFQSLNDPVFTIKVLANKKICLSRIEYRNLSNKEQFEDTIDYILDKLKNIRSDIEIDTSELTIKEVLTSVTLSLILFLEFGIQSNKIKENY